MSGTRICTAFDDAGASIGRINPRASELVELPVSRYGLDQPTVLDAIARLTQRGGKNPVRAYNEQGEVPLPEIAPSSIDELFVHSRNWSCTFNIEHLERYVPELCAMAVDFSAFFGGTIAVHAFVTAGGVPATPLHYDYSNAFTFQVLGRKWWQCYEYHDKPTYAPSGYVVNHAAVGKRTLDYVLGPGECLFIPMGGLHLVTALPNEDSLHLAVSVKPLGYHRYMAQLLDPELGLDHPGWVGIGFEAHIQRLARGARQVGNMAARGDIAERARTAVWGIVYETYAKRPYSAIANGMRASDAKSFRRALGRPFAAVRRPDCISVEILDAEPGPVGNYGFRPASVELPPEAEPFVAMLEGGAIDVNGLSAHYDTSSTYELLNLGVELGLLTAD